MSLNDSSNDNDHVYRKDQNDVPTCSNEVNNVNESPNTAMSSSSSSEYWLGLFFIFLVSVLWSGSSVLVQFIYEDSNNNDNSNSGKNISTNALTPFLVTYVGVSLFSLWLPFQFLSNLILHEKKNKPKYARDDTTESVNEIVMARTNRRNNGYMNLPTSSSIKDDENDNDEQYPHRRPDLDNKHNEYEDKITMKSPNDPLFIIDDDFDQSQEHCHHNQVDFTKRLGTNDHTETTEVQQLTTDDSINLKWTHSNYKTTALYIAPVWFIANWSYNASLAYTSVTSSTVLASTGSLFTFLFALLYKDEKYTSIRLLGVILGVSGSILTTWNDDDDENETTVNIDPNNNNDTHLAFQHHSYAAVGDGLGLISAIGYGAYAVQTRILCPHDESLYSMQTVLGYIGLLSMISLSPIAAYQLFLRNTTNTISMTTFGFLVLKGLFDNVLADYLWLRAVILTNATVATVGLGLTIPLAFISDIVLMGKGDSVLRINSLLGACGVLIGFVLVNTSSNNEQQVNTNNRTTFVTAATNPDSSTSLSSSNENCTNTNMTTRDTNASNIIRNLDCDSSMKNNDHHQLCCDESSSSSLTDERTPLTIPLSTGSKFTDNRIQNQLQDHKTPPTGSQTTTK